MKKRVMAVLFISVVLSFCAVMLSACNNFFPDFCIHKWQDATCTTPKTCIKCGKTEGTIAHTFQKIVDKRYLVSLGNCKEPSIYFYSCACGVRGNETFEVEIPDGHNFVRCVDNLDNRTHTLICANDPSHTLVVAHIFDKCVSEDKYIAEETTCIEPSKYYYSCECGAAGTETFEGETSDNHNFVRCVDNLDNRTHTLICANDPSHTLVVAHTFDKCVSEDKYIAEETTCIEPSKYYYSCECGAVGTETFWGGIRLHHIVVEDKEVPALLNENGLTKGSHCAKCGTVFTAQIETSALGSAYAGSESYVSTLNGKRYINTYSLGLSDNNRFTLTVNKADSSNSERSLEYFYGTLSYIKDGVYELTFDDNIKSMYVKFTDETVFGICNIDGSKWNIDIYNRPDGATKVDLVPRTGNNCYGYNDLVNNLHGEDMQAFYRRLYDVCEAFIGNSADIVENEGYYVIDIINLEEFDVTIEEAVAVWKVFYLENPRYYWLANSFSILGTAFKVCIDGEYSLASYRRECDEAIDLMIQLCRQDIEESMSELEIALAIHDYILLNMEYAYLSDGITPQKAIWAHNMIGFAKHKFGVCESYAKTYAYLCMLNGVECIVVSGEAGGEGHAWNLVCIDGGWYGVDCTWDDTAESGVIYDYFGMSARFTERTHTADSPLDEGIEYQYELPLLNTYALRLVKLYENGDFVGIYGNIDSAFEAMTNTGAYYEVQLTHYMHNMFAIWPTYDEYNILSTQTPVVKGITMNYSLPDNENKSYYLQYVYIANNLYLNSDLTFGNIALNGYGTLYLQDNRLTTTGDFVRSYIAIIGSLDDRCTSEIFVNAEYSSEFYGKLEVHTVTAKKEFMLYNEVHIVNCKTKYGASIRVYGTDDIVIDNLYCIDRWFTIWLNNGANVYLKNVFLDADGTLRIFRQFGKAEEFGLVTLGKVNCKVEFFLCGEVTYYIEDDEGNMIPVYTESINPKDIAQPIATLLDKTLYERCTVEIGNGCYDDHTDEYVLNKNNEIVLNIDAAA